MGKASRDKGARFERSLASKFREYGYDARRTAQYCGKTGDASDVVGLTRNPRGGEARRADAPL